jgi:hypothetical protein
LRISSFFMTVTAPEFTGHHPQLNPKASGP